jgi:hypothetical protein
MKDSFLDIIENFHNKYIDLKGKLPYSFNLLDMVKVDENGHSRVLRKLLAFKEGNDFPFLKSFLESIGFENLISKISNPKIYAEKDRIDVSIRDDEYAIIIENKIHNAIDQPTQIENYLKKLDSKRYSSDVYVLYLTLRGGAPSVQSESLKEEIRNNLGNKFMSINYRYHILPWLEGILNDSLFFDKNPSLKSGIEQYTDHLKRIFKINEDMKQMNEQLIKEIEEKFNLCNELSPQIKIDRIKDFENKCAAIIDYLEKTKIKYRSEISKAKFKNEYKSKWENFFIGEFKDIEIKKDQTKTGYWWLGIEMKYKKNRFLCGIGYDNVEEQSEMQLKPYYGITCRPNENIKKLDPNLKAFLQKEFSNKKSKVTKNWYVHNRVDFEVLEKKFRVFYDKVKKHPEVEISSNTNT